MARNSIKTIGITMGDPSGIGPEIILKGCMEPSFRKERIMVIGDYGVIRRAYGLLEEPGFTLNRISEAWEAGFAEGAIDVLDLELVDLDSFQTGTVQAQGGHAAFECIRRSVELAEKDIIDAVVTAPMNKEALHLAGHPYPGHTEIFATLTGTADYAMLLFHRKLSVIHVSTHVSLLEAVTGLRAERVEKVIILGDRAMQEILGRTPRIAVAGLNPHAGEHGLFGREEMDHISPAIRKAKGSGIHVDGPFPPDTLYLKALEGEYDLVVAMYHDQGHIPLKLLGFHSGVNVTVGLPFIRTSVDHGTAFDIAWQGRASGESLTEAVKLALRLA